MGRCALGPVGTTAVDAYVLIVDLAVGRWGMYVNGLETPAVSCGVGIDVRDSS
jgi:hypothetical protein